MSHGCAAVDRGVLGRLPAASEWQPVRQSARHDALLDRGNLPLRGHFAQSYGGFPEVGLIRSFISKPFLHEEVRAVLRTLNGG